MFLGIYGGDKITDLFLAVFWFWIFLENPWVVKGFEKSKEENILLKVFTEPFAPSENVSANCLKNSHNYLNSLSKYEPWALQMYDASAKISPGLLTGNRQHFGNYDECLRIKTQDGFAGQACIANIEFEVFEKEHNSISSKNLFVQISGALNITQLDGAGTFNYEWMWCVPSTCNYSEISQSLDRRFDPLRIQDEVNVRVKVNKVTCHSKENDRIVLSIEDWIYTGIILLFLAIIISSTAYDLARKKESKTFDHKDARHMMLSSFSLYTNGKNLFSIERKGNVIGCLDGLRFLSICWIIFGHTFYMETAGVKLDLAHISKMHENWSNLLVLNANIVTDIFFLISAILLAYTLLIRKEKNPDHSLNFIQLYVHRYFRLTPAYAMIIGFYATLFYKIGSGPHWNTLVGTNSNFCRKSWWTNLLYVNNYVNVDAPCLSQSWYLSVDMQLVLISPIFLYPMLKLEKRNFFWILLALGFIFSIIVPFLLTYCNKLPGTMLYYKGLADTRNVFLKIYIKTYARAGPYIMGLGLGYLLHKTSSYQISISRLYVISGWLLASTIGLSAVLGLRGLYYSYNRVEASFYAGLHRHAFALWVSWIIFTSSQGYAGPIGKLLSWRGWMPFSRLTYSAYLCHYIILLYYSGSVRTPGDLSTMNVLRSFSGNLTMTLLISTIICLCFEMPFHALARTLNNKKSNFTTKPNARELYESKSVDDSMASISQVGTDIVNIYKASDDTICNSIVDVSFYVNERKP